MAYQIIFCTTVHVALVEIHQESSVSYHTRPVLGVTAVSNNSNGKLNFSDCLVIHGLDHVYRNADFSFGFGYSRVRIVALSGYFLGHCLNEVLQTVHGYDRCCTPRCYTGHSGARNVKMSFLAVNFFAGEVQTS